MKEIIKSIILIVLISNTLSKSIKFLNNDFKPQYENAIKLIDGFLNATEFYTNVPSYQSCKGFNYDFGLRILDFIEIVRNTTDFNTNTTERLLYIISRFGDLLKNMSSNIDECRETPGEILKLYLNVSQYFSNPLYLKAFIENVKSQTFSIMELYARSDIFYESKDYFNCGYNLGKLVNLMFFPKLESSKDIFKSVINPDIDDIIKCLISGMTDPRKYLLFTKEASEVLHEKCGKSALSELFQVMNDILIKFDPKYENFTKMCKEYIEKCAN